MEQKQHQVEQQSALVRKLKGEFAPKDQITAQVEILKALKVELVELEKEMAASSIIDGGGPKKFDRAALEELLRKRFYYATSFSIYGGSYFLAAYSVLMLLFVIITGCLLSTHTHTRSLLHSSHSPHSPHPTNHPPQASRVCSILVRLDALSSPISWTCGENTLSSRKTCWNWIALS